MAQAARLDRDLRAPNGAFGTPFAEVVVMDCNP